MSKAMVRKLEAAGFGEFFGTDLTKLRADDSESRKERIMKNISDGIGKVVSVIMPNGLPTKGILEDIDFETDPQNKRHIAKIFDEDENPQYIDTLYDKDWKIKTF